MAMSNSSNFMKQAAHLPLSSFDVAAHANPHRQPLISHNYQMATSGSSNMMDHHKNGLRLDSDRGPDTQLMMMQSNNNNNLQPHNLQHVESGSMRLSTDPGGHSATMLHAVPFTNDQHNTAVAYGNVNRQSSQPIGANWIKSPAASSGRSVAFSNLPNKQQLLTSTNNNIGMTRESGATPVTTEEQQQASFNNHQLYHQMLYPNHNNKGLLESRKTQRQNVSYYFSNNDTKLIPTRRTNYLIGAQSTSLPLVAAQAYMKASSILSQHHTQSGTITGELDLNNNLKNPAIISTKMAQMRGTLEYNQQKLAMMNSRRNSKPQSQPAGGVPLSAGDLNRPHPRLSLQTANQPPQTAPGILASLNGYSTTSKIPKASAKPKASQGVTTSSQQYLLKRQPWELPVSLPLRGRPVTIGDRTRDIVGRCDALKKNFNTQLQGLLIEQRQSEREFSRKSIEANPLEYMQNMYKQPLGTKIYDFQPKSRAGFRSGETNFLDPQAYTQQATTEAVQDQVNQLANAPQMKKSIDNLLKFLDLNNNNQGTVTGGDGPEGNVKQSMPIVDINRLTELPMSAAEKRQNKNDFYRFLLMQNSNQQQAEETNLTTIGQRANNDILIPRSILKKCERNPRTRGDNTLSEDEDDETQAALYGVKLKRTNPLLSPKFNQVLQERQKEVEEQRENQILLEQHLQHLKMLKHQEELLYQEQQKLHQEQLAQQMIHVPREAPMQFTPPQPMPTTDLLTTHTDQMNNVGTGKDFDEVNILSTKGDEMINSLDLNKDLHNIQKEEDGVPLSPPKMKTVIVKHTEMIGGEGFFQTQVEVIEKEEHIQVPADEPKKGEPIFAFSNFSDFRTKYFNKEVDPVSEFTRIKSIQQARAKYSKRFNQQQPQYPEQQLGDFAQEVQM